MATGDVLKIGALGDQEFGPPSPTILLTGAETDVGNFFRGPEDPADTPAYDAILEPGDLWVDTNVVPISGYPPFVTKMRDNTNTFWVMAGLVFADGDGKIVATASVDGGTPTIQVLDATGTALAVATLQSTSLSLTMNDATGASAAALELGNDGLISFVSAAPLAAPISISTGGTINFTTASPPTSNGAPIGTQAAAVADVVDPMDPESVAATLDALLAAMRASGLLAP